ncbi:TetR/AcrR family transcriptional regulator [Streptomyces sulphureus]|uniref:TetR/AcrR family transcriptional regulator n=1 Tax=Streptomyces sulphureus TaxID=47758 RepID=UPI000363A800|nr:TetR/AcrR family transcriptional regulator [Streptomyces sulphureus]
MPTPPPSSEPLTTSGRTDPPETGEPGITRRSSYGPTSPEVGVRGATTRRRVTEAALELFGTDGFFPTSVEAIAKQADVSRATLYQYFSGKKEIFLELMDECAAALVRVSRRIGELGPTELGFDNLNWWLGEWSWVFEKYRTMFVQWSVVASVDSKVRPEVLHFIGGYNQRFATRLSAARLSGIDPVVAATAMTAVVDRLNLFLHTGRAHDADGTDLTSALSTFLQLTLFPETRATVLNSLSLEPSRWATIERPQPPEAEELALSSRVEGLSRRAVTTVRSLVEAGTVQFGRKGYHRTSVDDIVGEAGFARGTFYKYFSEKQDLLRTVCVETTARTVELADRLRSVDVFDDEAMRSWLTEFLGFLDRYRGTRDLWTEQRAEDELVVALGAHAQAVIDSAFASLLASVERDYPFDPVAGALIFRALLTRVPEAMREESSPPLSEEQTVDLLLQCIRRGFFTQRYLRSF